MLVFNTLKMINNNNPNDPTFNMNGSIRINKSTSQDADYNDAKATQLCINYDNDTSDYIDITDAQITILDNLVKDTAVYEFVVYCPSNKKIKNLQIMILKIL